jgi:hypothetical protein
MLALFTSNVIFSVRMKEPDWAIFGKKSDASPQKCCRPLLAIPEHLIFLGLPVPLLSSNMYENQKRFVSLLSKSCLPLLRTIWQGQHHSSFVLHHDSRQTASLPL